jgi:hypothetical protein
MSGAAVDAPPRAIGNASAASAGLYSGTARRIQRITRLHGTQKALISRKCSKVGPINSRIPMIKPMPARTIGARRRRLKSAIG